jgi:hypothetical protein
MFRVLTYSFEGAQRETKSISAFESGHGWWRSIARRIEKRNYLRAQRFHIDNIQMVDVYTGPRAARGRR